MRTAKPTIAEGSQTSDLPVVRPWSGVERTVIVVAVVVGIVARFVTRSPLWLDEALSVNIARLPVNEIFDALRHDGHPPLYYLTLHGWMNVFGESDATVRSLSGLFALGALALAYVAGRRRLGPTGGLSVVLVTAVAPFAVRYGTEARMYAMVSFLVLAAFLVAEDLARFGGRARWLGLAGLTGATLLTHYWALYLGAAAVAVLAWRWWRSGERDVAIRVGSSLAAGAVLFVPWLPAFLYQAGHTGTPWGAASRPTTAVVDLLVGLGGEAVAEAYLFGLLVGLLALLGLTVAAASRVELSIDFRSVAGVRLEMALVGLTLVFGLAAGLLTASTFVSRYAAVITPFLFIAAGIGLSRLSAPSPRRLAAAGLLALSVIGIAVNVTRDRTQGAEIAAAIEANGDHADLVVFCPDQLGPSTLRQLPPTFEAMAVPALDRPDRIDWVDYADRNRSADPAALAQAVLDRADGRRIWLVVNYTYRTYEGVCEGLQAGLSLARPVNEVVVGVREDVFEPANLIRFDPVP